MIECKANGIYYRGDQDFYLDGRLCRVVRFIAYSAIKHVLCKLKGRVITLGMCSGDIIHLTCHSDESTFEEYENIISPIS